MRGGGDALIMDILPMLENPTVSQLVSDGMIIGSNRQGYNAYASASNAPVFVGAYRAGDGYNVYAASKISAIVWTSFVGSLSSASLPYDSASQTYNKQLYGIANTPVTKYDSLAAFLQAVNDYIPPITTYPIHYFHTDGCTITGPADAAPGQDCVVIVNPSEGYTFKGSSGVRIQDSSGANVPFIISGNRISFTYPQPI